MSLRVSILAALCCVTGNASLANQPDLTALIADSIGYVTIRPNVVLIEGDEFDSFVCKFDADDDAFATYAETGELDPGRVGYACIPLEEFEK
ncbi:MAG: hypothetical protein ACU0GG_10855 [Paracoccaceae bacterium]